MIPIVRVQACYRFSSRLLHGALFAGLLCVFTGQLQAQDIPGAGRIDPPGYLAGRSIGHQSPPAPAPDSPGQKPDYEAVLKARDVSEWRKQQAFEDAGAYAYDLLLPRFSESAGTALSVTTTPILAYVLRRMLVDLTGTKGLYGVTISGYVPAVKHDNVRNRPFVGHPDLSPCQTDYLFPDANHSYPSGHAAEGQVAAELLALVIPERASRIRARGERFGDNRLVCGVHYPSDLAEGRKIALAYFDAVMSDPVFRQELNCAIEERRKSVAAPVSSPSTPPGACHLSIVLVAPIQP